MTRLLTGPNVWTAADLESGEPYVRRLTEPDLDALDNASDLTDLIADITDRLQNGMGYALLRGLPVGTRYTPEEAARLHRTLAERLGEIVPQNRTGDLSILLEDARHPAQPSGTYASKAGAPFHTDPTDIVSYLCLAPARSGGARVLASAATLYNSLAREHPEWLDLVSRDYATDREGQEPPGEPGWVSRPIFSTNGGGTLTCSLSPKRIMSAMRFEDVPRLDAEEMTCLMYLESLLRRPGTAVHVALEAGDMEFVNNHTVIHSRTGFVDDPSDPAHQRKLRRLWIDVS